jgi:hypothetical protein
VRHALNLLLLTLCFCALQPLVRTSPPDQSSQVNQAVGSLVSRLKGARAVKMPRTNFTLRLSSIRAEGCVLRYEITSELEQPGGPPSMDRPQDSAGTIYRTVDELMVDLADLDPTSVDVRNPARIKGGVWVFFSVAGGREAISRTWQERSRLGVWMRTQQLRLGYFPLRDEGEPWEVAEALRRAIMVCKNPSN